MHACVIPTEFIRAQDTGSFFIITEQGSTPSTSHFSPINAKPKNSKSISLFSSILSVKGLETPSRSAYLSIDATYQRGKIDALRQASYEQILSFKSLDRNWDGFGAIPINVKCASSALSIINHFEEPELNTIIDLFPNNNGSICIKWENNGNRLTLSIGAKNFSFYYKQKDLKVEFYDNQHINDASVAFLIEKIKSIIYDE